MSWRVSWHSVWELLLPKDDCRNCADGALQSWVLGWMIAGVAVLIVLLDAVHPRHPPPPRKIWTSRRWAKQSRCHSPIEPFLSL